MRRRGERIRWAVVGQGHFAQTSILPAFAHARENSELVAIFSGDERKRRQLARRHRAEFALPYEELEDFLRSGQVQAVYLAVPNHKHRDLTVAAARAGVHVLCEKPMAATTRDCRDMIAACEDHRVKLMIAYRLHLERANLTAIDEIRRGRIGEPRYFTSSYSYPLTEDDNVRGLPTEQGGGPLFDIGIYCINAARYLFADEPVEAAALSATAPDDPRFADTEEQVSAVLRFPGERLASFTAGFGASAVSRYTVSGTRGSLTLEPAFTHSGRRQLQVEGKRTRKMSFPDRDQVAPELVYFADCVLHDREPEPSGWEGFHDVAVIEAIMDSARTGRKIAIELEPRRQRPTKGQAIDKPPAKEPSPIHAEAPRGG